MRALLPLLVFLVFFTGCIFEDEVTMEAMRQGDPTICRDLNNTGKEKACVIKVAGKTERLSICTDYFADERENLEKCVSKVAASKLDQTLCDRITGDDVRDRCYNDVHFKKGGGDPGICAKIKGDGAKSLCYVRTANVRGEPKYCEQIPGGRQDGSRDDCVYSASMNGAGLGGCAGIVNESIKDKCQTILGDDPDGCDKLSKYERQRCLESVAQHHGNDRACVKIEEGRRDNCLSLLARATNSTKPCKESSSTYRDICIKIVAEDTMDVVACDEISDPGKRGDCVEDVGRAIKKHRKDTGTQTAKDKIEERVNGWIGDLLTGQLDK